MLFAERARKPSLALRAPPSRHRSKPMKRRKSSSAGGRHRHATDSLSVARGLQPEASIQQKSPGDSHRRGRCKTRSSAIPGVRHPAHCGWCRTSAHSRSAATLRAWAYLALAVLWNTRAQTRTRPQIQRFPLSKTTEKKKCTTECGKVKNKWQTMLLFRWTIAFSPRLAGRAIATAGHLG